jgi:arsenate reductase (thioredoxin)
MSDQPYNVLFVCTDNSARSIMAEGLLNHLGRGRFNAYSAGTHPKGEVDPFALQALAHHSVQTEGLHTKSWNEFAHPDAPLLDFVITVCDTAAGEVCPVWPGQPVTAQWGVHDPAAFSGSDDAKLKHFIETALVLKWRIDLMMALQIGQLDDLSLRREMRDIGIGEARHRA